MTEKNKKTKNAFTLAEVIIALALMGVLLALSIPTLLVKTNTSGHVQKLKKMYGILYTATNDIMLNNSGTLGGAYSNTMNAANTFLKYLECNKFCDIGDVIGECWATSTNKLSGGAAVDSFDADVDYAGIVLPDGSSMLIKITRSNCDDQGISSDLPYSASTDKNNLCGYIVVDTNGYLNSPNTFGSDIFMFLLGKNGLYSGGDPHTQYNLVTNNNNCTTTPNGLNGYGCTNKVLNEGAMNY